MTINLNNVMDAYLTCALWSSTDMETDRPLDDDFGPDDVHPDSIAEHREQLDAFVSANADDIEACGMRDDQVGDDFWLTRNGHGAGFWDRGYGAAGVRLTANCKAYGSSDAYVGDDGMIHLS